MNILCVIPARGRSKRIPNKNIRMLLGKPLIAYSIEKALESELCTRAVVSTDDLDIAAVAKEYGLDVIMRPEDLALDDSPIDDTLRHAVRYLEQKEGFVAEVVVLLQANTPLRKEGEIDEVINKLMKNNNATAVATVYAVDQRPEWTKIVNKKTGMMKPFMKPTDSYRKQVLPELYLVDGAIAAIKVQTLMETEGIRKAHAYLGDRVYAVMHAKKLAIEIDKEEDLELAEYYLLREKSR